MFHIADSLVRLLEKKGWQPRWLSWRRYPAPYFFHYSYEDRNPQYICEQMYIEITVRVGQREQSFGLESRQCID